MSLRCLPRVLASEVQKCLRLPYITGVRVSQTQIQINHPYPTCVFRKTVIEFDNPFLSETVIVVLRF